MGNNKKNRRPKKSGQDDSQQHDQSQAGDSHGRPLSEQGRGPRSVELDPQLITPHQQFPLPGPSPDLSTSLDQNRLLPVSQQNPEQLEKKAWVQIEKPKEKKIKQSVQEASEPNLSPVEASIQDNQPEKIEKPSTSESLSATDNVGKKKKRKKKAGSSADKSLEESFKAALVMDSSSVKPVSKTTQDESRQTSEQHTKKAWAQIEKPVQKTSEPKDKPIKTLVQGNQPGKNEKPISEPSSATDNSGQKKEKTKKAGVTVDKPFKELSNAALVMESSSGKSETKTTPGKISAQESARTTQRSLSIPKRGIVNHSSKYFESDNGRPLETNYLRVDFNMNLKIFQYSVAISPEKRKNLYREAIRLLFQTNGINRHPAYDGNTLLFAGGRKLKFPGDTQSFTGSVEVSFEGKPIQYDISINFAREISNLRGLAEYMRSGSSLNPFDVQALDIALLHAAFSNPGLIKAGRSFFTPPHRGQFVQHLGNGMDLWTGHCQSIVVPQSVDDKKPYLYLNVDVAHKAFPKGQPVLSYIEHEFFSKNKLSSSSTLDGRQIQRAKGFLTGLRIEYNAPGLGPRRFKVDSLGLSAREAKFTPGENQRITTVEDYFKNTRHFKLQYPLLPCIKVRKLLFPMELCKIVPNQPIKKQLDRWQTDKMVKGAALPTIERKANIQNSIRNVRFANDDCLREFDLAVSDKFETVPKHVLIPPTLQYARSTVPVGDGKWDIRFGKNIQFIAPVNLKNWVLINTDPELKPGKIFEVVQEFKNAGPLYGVTVEDAVCHINLFDYRDTTEDGFVNVFQKFKLQGVQFFMVIMKDERMYSNIKRAAEIRVGVLTQCIKAITAKIRFNRATAANILLKLNAKIGGVNHTLVSLLKPEILDEDVMLVGADVTHPRPDSNEVSIAAVAASHDEYGFQYNMMYALQPPETNHTGKKTQKKVIEIILEIEKMITSQIEVYKEKTKKLPKRIIYYRDGVSESQFGQVLDSEVVAIRRACAKFSAPHRITITVIVVQKRHHTRFFPCKEDSDGTKYVNVRAGTVVDEKITHPTELDFYLVSHASIQGTARPTKYHLLYDDSSPAIDQETLQRMTYYLCHTYARCNRSVSYPAPTYYAHWAAFRAKAYYSNHQFDFDDLKRDQERNGKIRDDVIKATPMFFI